jgi:hypothetical protein
VAICFPPIEYDVRSKNHKSNPERRELLKELIGRFGVRTVIGGTLSRFFVGVKLIYIAKARFGENCVAIEAAKLGSVRTHRFLKFSLWARVCTGFPLHTSANPASNSFIASSELTVA